LKVQIGAKGLYGSCDKADTPMRFAHFNTLVSITLVMLCLALAGGVASAAENQTLSAEEQAFLNRALSDDAAQIAMAQMALTKSTNPKILALANTIIQERTALDAKLEQVLAATTAQGKAKLITAGNDATLTALQSLNGDAFDKTFAGLLIRDHYRIISAYEAMKSTCTHTGLQSITRDAVPALQDNLTVALDFLRSENWKPSAHPSSLTAVDAHGSKVPVYWESISIVAAPW
jgi:putative membrane protein